MSFKKGVLFIKGVKCGNGKSNEESGGGTAGNIRYNADTDIIQIYANGEWVDWKAGGINTTNFINYDASAWDRNYGDNIIKINPGTSIFICIHTPETTTSIATFKRNIQITGKRSLKFVMRYSEYQYGTNAFYKFWLKKPETTDWTEIYKIHDGGPHYGSGDIATYEIPLDAWENQEVNFRISAYATVNWSGATFTEMEIS